MWEVKNKTEQGRKELGFLISLEPPCLRLHPEHMPPKLILSIMLNLLVSRSHSTTTLNSSNDKKTSKVTLLPYLSIISANKLLRAITCSTNSLAWKQPKIFNRGGKKTLAKQVKMTAKNVHYPFFCLNKNLSIHRCLWLLSSIFIL